MSRSLKKILLRQNRGSAVLKFSSDGELLMTLGTPGEMGDPPSHFTQPNDVVIAPNGNIYVAETHGAQFQDEPGPDSKSRISIFAPDGSFIKNFWRVGFRRWPVPFSSCVVIRFPGAACS